MHRDLQSYSLAKHNMALFGRIGISIREYIVWDEFVKEGDVNMYGYFTTSGVLSVEYNKNYIGD